MIVVGVLLALAAEAAWAERSDRLREQELLADLLEEFQENEARLLSDIEQNRTARAAASLWVEVMLGEVAVSRDSIGPLFIAGASDARFDPVTGALRSLVDGGELQLIKNDDLRRALAGWPALAAEARLTANSWDNQRQSLNPVVLALEPGQPLTSGEEVAVRLAAESTGRVNRQLEALVDRVRDIIALIQSEMSR